MLCRKDNAGGQIRRDNAEVVKAGERKDEIVGEQALKYAGTDTISLDGGGTGNSTFSPLRPWLRVLGSCKLRAS